VKRVMTWWPAWLVLAASAAFAATPPAGDGPRHLGVASCASTTCHGSAKGRTATPVAQTEYVNWQHFDPHAGAFAALDSPRGREIARRLGLPAATAAPECLACHSEAPQARARGPRFQADDGVGCESCHGAAERWIASHYDTPRVTHADNLAAGLRALNVPTVRAQVCLDCHVGASDRLATHRMMAAGHPRLVFELDTYTEIWRTSGGREHYPRSAAYHARKAEPSPADVWIAGLLAQASRQLSLLTPTSARGHALLPEFALFNCYSCHRGMGLARWAERRPAGVGSVGELHFDDAALRLVAAVVATRNPSEASDLLRQVHELQLAPARDWDAVQAAARALDASLERLSAAPPALSPAEAGELAERLAAAAGRGEYPDYAGAEQVAMGIVVLLADDGQATQSPSIEALFASLADDDRFDLQRFRNLVKRVAK
jgi:hypothetical protein